MTTQITRRRLLQTGAGLAGTAALVPHWALAQQAAINYWHTFTSQSEFAGLEAVMAAFHAANPDITVTQENIPNPEFMAKVTAAVVANSRPDVTMVASERFADLHAMGALIDLTDRLAAWDRRGDFDDSRFASITDANGRIYGLPAFAFVPWMYYRKDWFDAEGLAPPATYAELEAAAIAITDPAQSRFGFGMRGGAGGQSFIIDVMEAYGSPIVSDGVIGLERDKAIEAVTWYSGLLTQHGVVPPSAPNDGFRQIMEAFQTGQTGMVWHHTGSFQDMANILEPGVQFATAPLPAGPVRRVARLGYAFNCMTSEANADASWDWISFWGEPDAAVALLEATGYFPASSVAAADPRIAGNPLYAPASETLGFGGPPPSFPGYAGWSESTVLPLFQAVLIGQQTPEQAVDQMIAALDEAIR
jgi:multiple sugar transport system substrate-binding protein